MEVGGVCGRVCASSSSACRKHGKECIAGAGRVWSLVEMESEQIKVYGAHSTELNCLALDLMQLM